VFSQTELAQVKTELRAKLSTLSEQFLLNFDDKTQKTDLTMDKGSSGILYGAYRYFLLLQQEDKVKMCP
jgi:hypothetical protein